MKQETLYKINGLYRDDFRVTAYQFGEGEKSLCVVGSMREMNSSRSMYAHS